MTVFLASLLVVAAIAGSLGVIVFTLRENATHIVALQHRRHAGAFRELRYASTEVSVSRLAEVITPEFGRKRHRPVPKVNLPAAA